MNFSLPKYVKPKPLAILIYADREVCNLKTAAGKAEYRKRTEWMADRQGQKCAICEKPFSSWLVPTFDHAKARGMGGGFRDDRIYDSQGRWLNASLCLFCQGAKGSSEYEWDDRGRYVPVRRAA